ncbi:MAG: Gfo/Idh/MocA family protein [Thermoproteota archaeon]
MNDPSNPNHVEGFEATHLFGLDERRNNEVARLGRIKNIVSDPIEMIGKIDIAFIEFRHGGLHLDYARPFIESGIPVFIDKPLAVNTADAKRLIQLAKEHNVPMTSFSTLRFTNLAKELGDLFKAEEPVFLSVTGPADPESGYGGLIFYAIHVAELFNEIAGFGIHEVMAIRRDKNTSATLVHEKVLGKLMTSSEIDLFAAEGVTKKSYIAKKLGDEPYYRNGIIKIREMLDGKFWPLDAQDMFESVAIIKAIEESILSGKPAKVETLS